MDLRTARFERGVTAPAPEVVLLVWEDCPSHHLALAQLRRLVAEAGLDPDAVERREIVMPQDAVDENFVGSPTVRIDGRDVVDPGDEGPALTCRVYRRRDGGYAPLPEDADIRAALQAALRAA